LLIPTTLAGQSPPPRWTATEDLRIGSIDRPDYALTSISDLEIGDDGSIYVAQSSEGLIRVFGADGVFRKRIGRLGVAPGEFRSIARLGWKGDTLWVYDPTPSRWTYFRADGALLEAHAVYGPMLDTSTRPTQPERMLADGTLIGTPFLQRDVRQTALLHIDRDGNLLGSLSTISTIAYVEVPFLVGGSRAAMQAWNPVESHSLWTVSPIDTSVVIVHRPLPSSSRQTTFVVEKVKLSGEAMFRKEFTYTPLPTTNDHYPRAMAPFVQDLSRFMDASTAARTLRNAITLPPYQAPITYLVAGSDGTTWLRRENLEPGNAVWWVLDERGAQIATLDLPTGATIMRANREMAWVTELDDLDIPYVIRYRIRPM